MNQSQSAEDAPPPKGPPKKFKPRRKPIQADEPTRQEQPSPAPIAKTTAHIESLKPKAKAIGKPTEPKNDPLDIPETLVLGLSGLSQRPGKLQYRVDASGYVDLVRATYSEITASDRYFERSVTLAMFEHYCSIAYWLRAYQILFDSGKDQHRAYKQLLAILPTEFPIPAPVSEWLAGLGNFTDPSGKRFELDVFLPLAQNVSPDVPMRGGFGVAAAATLPHYASNIAPFLSLYRVYAEACVNQNWVDNHYNYTLPGMLDFGENLPNVNLLGYFPLLRPHQDVNRNLLRLGIFSTINHPEDLHITLGTPPLSVRGIPYVPGLIEYIGSKVSTITGIRLMPTIPTNKIGSSAQVGYITLEEYQEAGPLPRYLKNTEREITGYSAHQLSVKVGSAIPCMKYRIEKRCDPVAPRPELFPYSTNNIPAGWAAHINGYFTHGAQARWNVDDFNTPTVNGKLISEEFIRKFQK